MIHRFEEIPITATSYPFASAEKYLHISEAGYEEREYYMYGTANVYRTEQDGSIGVKNADVPYVNRIIVRAPKDPAACSGNVSVEIINATSGMEIDRMWILTHRQIVRNGDIYIGITSKHATFAKLLEFDAERYAKLSWPNPTPEIPFDFTPEDLMKESKIVDQDITKEPGLFWDMLSDLARVLRQDAEINPIRAYHPSVIVLTGWSQSADYTIRYINDFAYRDGDTPDLYDGFLIGAPVRFFVTPVNQYEAGSTKPTARNMIVRRTKNPVVILQTESENGIMGGSVIRRVQSDSSDFLCREYDVAGSSHDTQYSMLDYYQNDPDLLRIHYLPHYGAQHKVPNNYPSHFLFAAAYRNLINWARYGFAPAAEELIPTDERGYNQKDALGNSVGGLRTCLINYPTGVYYNYSEEPGRGLPVYPEPDKNFLFGHEEPFSAEMLKAMYGSLEHYRALVTEDTLRQVTKGFIVREDAEELIQFAVNLAESRGLK